MEAGGDIEGRTLCGAGGHQCDECVDGVDVGVVALEAGMKDSVRSGIFHPSTSIPSIFHPGSCSLIELLPITASPSVGPGPVVEGDPPIFFQGGFCHRCSPFLWAMSHSLLHREDDFLPSLLFLLEAHVQVRSCSGPPQETFHLH